MSQEIECAKESMISSLVAKCQANMTGKQSVLCSEFIRQFFGTVFYDDLNAIGLDDLYGAAVNFWTLINVRHPNETKIHIYNPDVELNGWQTTHTVVEVICEDMPFLVDSLRMVVQRMGLALHLIIHMGGIRLTRTADGHVSSILPRQGDPVPHMMVEAPIWMEIDRQIDPDVLRELHDRIEQVLKENRAVVDDWSKMAAQVRASIKELNHPVATLNQHEVDESKAFLSWIEDHHFTFLGVRDYELHRDGQAIFLHPVPNTGLGVLRDELSHPHVLNITALSPEAKELTLSSHILLISKTATLATVHRDTYTDYIGIKRFNAQGEVIGERRILGLYTSAAYNTNPKHIPFLRHKISLIFENSQLNPRSHAGRVLMNILETLPRDDLIQATEAELLDMGMGIFYMQERSRIRLFARVDPYHRFISCLVYVPKDRFNTEMRQAMQDVLRDYFHATDISFSTFFSESILARIHFMIRVKPQEQQPEYDFKALEKKLIDIGRSWIDDLYTYLLESCGETQAVQLFSRYKQAFSPVYTASFSPRTAVIDIQHMERLSPENPLGMSFYRPLTQSDSLYYLKIFQHDVTIPLSEVLPILENLGLRAISERPYVLTFGEGERTWINEFSLEYPRGCSLALDELRDLFQQAFSRVWFNHAENDGFNQLVLAASLDWRQVAVLRAYAKYFKQIGFVFSQDYIESALNHHPALAKKLVHLFELRFHPSMGEDRAVREQAIMDDLILDLDQVDNLDEDKIIRQFIHAIGATLRTNYYQKNEKGDYKTYISLKLNSHLIPGVPRPHPLYEIFVYSPSFEAVHLRCSKVARGGLRWSDRREDFRTEILGLMKAQQVKNAVIVPSGAKGGFVVKRNMSQVVSREEVLAEGILCYQQFIRGLLDITDNHHEQNIIKPNDVVCYDDDDPYLVVAADKGTATFSDIANAISLEYGFWLGDAFASGGSIGYDHKKMGITAKGAWESVKRHFYELNMDLNTTDFTVVGIGDMAGDVFGNGMLLSSHIQLVAAFNHMHIFIDPNPDASRSFQERQRLFHLPRSTWLDYNPELISAGGGVFSRTAKFIPVSEAMKQRFGLEKDVIEPNELIQCLLMAKIDLLWSAGIGTFVKSVTENHQDVGDRSNDLIRVNGMDLRCLCVVEGGNLGFTQLGRIEYALTGGRLYTDFIDNSAGVSCSDKEVNIKILLNRIVASGDLTQKQRQELLVMMTDEVSELVLKDNFLQTRAISLSKFQASKSADLYARYLQNLIGSGQIDRKIEFLPDEKTLMERKLMGQGLTSPEISVLLCYSKNLLKESIVDSDVPEDPFLDQYLVACFPRPLQTKFAKAMQQHPLKRDIIATKISNMIVNEMGFSFVYRLQDETGAPVSVIVRAYIIARSLLNMDEVWREIDSLDQFIGADEQMRIMMVYIRLLRRLSSWFLRHHRSRLHIGKTVALYQPQIRELTQIQADHLSEPMRAQYDEHYQVYVQMNIPKLLAHKLTMSRSLFAVMDIVQIAQKLKLEVTEAAVAYFSVGEALDMTWLRLQIIAHPTENHWEALSREALRDDLDWQQRQLTLCIFSKGVAAVNGESPLEVWAQHHVTLVERWQHMLTHLRSSPTLTYTMFFVVIRELLDLTQTSLQTQESDAH